MNGSYFYKWAFSPFEKLPMSYRAKKYILCGAQYASTMTEFLLKAKLKIVIIGN